MEDQIKDGSHSKVWTYAPSTNASHWDEFYKKGIIGLGWIK